MIWEIIFWLFLIPLAAWGLHKLFKYSAIGIPFIKKNQFLYWVFMILLILIINFLVKVLMAKSQLGMMELLEQKNAQIKNFLDC